MGVAAAFGPFGQVGVDALAVDHQRRQQADVLAAVVAHQLRGDALHALRPHRRAVVHAALHAELDVEQAQEMPDFGGCRHRALAPAAREALLDGDRRRDAPDRVHLGPAGRLHDAARVGVQRFEVAALALVEQDVEGQRALARAAVAHQPHHLARADVQVQVADDRARAVAEMHPLHRDRALDIAERQRLRRVGHVGDMVQDVEDALGTGRGLLRDGHDAAHRVEAAVEAADIGQKGGQRAHRDALVGDQPDAHAPDHQQAHLGQQRDAGREQAPGAVQPVIDLQVLRIGFAKPRGFAFLLSEGLDDADARNRVGQHVGDLAPDPVDLLESGAQPVAHQVDQPGDEGQRHQRGQRQPGVDAEQDDGSHRQHQHIGDEVQRMQAQEHADAVGLGADARHQVAGALVAEVFERQAQQVLEGGGAQVGRDALRHQRQQIGLGPAQSPGEQRRAEQAAEQQRHQHRVDGLAALERNQHPVHQRHGQVGRDQGRTGRAQHQREPQQQLALVGPREAPQPQQHPGAGRRGAFAKVEIRVLVSAGIVGHDLARQALQFTVKGIRETHRRRIAGQGEAPAREATARVKQLHEGQAAVVAQPQALARRERESEPLRTGRLEGQQARIGQRDQARGEAAVRIQVNLQRRHHVLAGLELPLQGG
mmetsp:Transcript_21531/g.83650  ORF Transcript_21531/g.83650 Transcript_21531/m.83650 type:complete len:653 (-) Transcript_21531:1654-3612(-)